MTEAGERGAGVRFDVIPQGAFNLATANRHFGGWVRETPGDELTVLMAFPIEGCAESAAVLLRQDEEGAVSGEVYTASGVPSAAIADRAWRQALAVLSLDVDGAGFAAIGAADPVIGDLQRRHPGLRPVLFHSPYEAAAAFLIGHRISIRQGRAIRGRIARAS